MKSIPRNRKSARAFTLIELLIVITIIGILAGISVPAYSLVKRSALKTSARNDAVQIVNAINAYRTEYGRYPLKPEPGAGGKTDPAEPIKTEMEFMKILFAEEDATAGDVLNPRGIVYFEGKIQNKVGTHGLDLDGNYYDPWGNPYEIYIDGNYDNRVTYMGKEFRRGVLVRSWGPDGVGEMPEDEGKTDDVKSW